MRFVPNVKQNKICWNNWVNYILNVRKSTCLICYFYMSVFRIHNKADTMTYIPTALYVSSALYMRTAPDSYLSWRKCYSVWYSPVAGLPTGNLILVDSTNNNKKTHIVWLFSALSYSLHGAFLAQCTAHYLFTVQSDIENETRSVLRFKFCHNLLT
jgi:hypothetical protein